MAMNLDAGYTSDNAQNDSPIDSTPQTAQPDKPEPEVRRAELATPADKAQQQYTDALETYQKFMKDAMISEESYMKNKQWVDTQMQQLLSQQNEKMPSFEEIYGQQTNPPDQEKLKKQYGLSVLAYSAIALPLMFAFGRGSGTQAGAMRGFAEGLNGIRESYDQKAQQGISLWKAQNDMRYRMGVERMNYYKEVLANRKLDKTEKMELLGHIAEYYKDAAVSQKTLAEDYKGVVDHLEKQERLLRQQENHYRQHEGKTFDMVKSKDRQEYITRLLEKYPDLRKGLQSAEGSDAWWKAYDEGMKRYPYAEFQQQMDEERQKTYQMIHPPKVDKSKEPDISDPLHLGLGKEPANAPQGGASGDW